MNTSVLDGRVRSLRDNLSKQWSELLYNGMYLSPEREFLQRTSTPEGDNVATKY